jgi:hypothetical protein
MKKFFRPPLAVLAVALLASVSLAACATLPPPRTASDALVVGYLSLDFPDGYLGQPPRVVHSYILLHFRNATTGARFSRLTHDGWFAFRVPGGQELVLRSYEYSSNEPYFKTYLNDEIGIRFKTEPGKVLDLGRITLRYTAPAVTNHVTFARSTYFDADNNGTKSPFMVSAVHDFWSYQRAVERKYDPAAFSRFLHRADPEGRWQSQEVVR